MKIRSIQSVVLVTTLLSTSFAFADITGKVYRDYDANGQQTLAETGVAGITINGADSAGGICTTTTGNDGSYTLSGCSGATRVVFDFTAQSHFYAGANGSESDSNVRFVNDGDSGVDFALQNPGEYCQADPYISTAYMWEMNAGNTEQSLVNVPYSSGVTSPSGAHYQTASWQDVPPVDLGTNGQIGSVFGMAWNRTDNYLYTSAMKAQYVPFGPGGRGQIYRTEIDPDTGAAVGSPQPWVNVETDLGRTVCGSDATLTYSDAHWDEVGKCSLGDLEISDDDQSLYVTNITSKEIIEIDVATGNMNQPIAFPLNAADCASGTADIFPFGLAYKDGKLFAGGVCTAESTGDASDANVFVYRLDDPATPTWTKVISFAPEDARVPLYGPGTSWKAWVSAYPGDNGYYFQYEQAMLTDIEFYGDDMILGLRDRVGDQVAEGVIINGTTMNGVGGRGDVLCATYSAATNDYALETSSPNSCGGRSAPGTGQGDGDGEFYSGDGNPSGDSHSETTMGNLTVFGSSHLLIGGVNPSYAVEATTTANAGGLIWLDNEDGTAEKVYYLYQGATEMSKGNGIGDIEALCDPAPLEVGNRVWEDTDGDGEQDAGEAPISGVAVTLTCGAQTASTTTDANGHYLFKDGTDDVASWTDGIIPRDADCEVSISEADAALGGKVITVADQASGDDAVDSDGTSSGGNAIKAFRTGAAGQNDHTYDFGFRDAPSCVINQPTVSAQCDDNGTSSDPNDDRFSYTINATGTGVGLTYSISGGDTQTNLGYDTDHSGLGDFAISGGDITLTLTDDTTGSCTLGNVTVAAPATCSNQTATCTTVTNNVSITASDQTDTDNTNDTASADLAVNCSNTPMVDVSLTKTASATDVVSGDTVTYTLTVSNAGPDTATGVEVSDQLPAGVSYSSHNASQGTFTSGTGIWAVGDLANGANATLTIDVTVD